MKRVPLESTELSSEEEWEWSKSAIGVENMRKVGAADFN